jgi:2-isopropylmalate synthase
MKHSEILVCDQTIREGMQYRGIVFTYEERLKMIEFQEALGVDISQAAYPSAHESEKDALRRLKNVASNNKYRIRIAGLGRSLEEDVDQIVETGAVDIHMHSVIKSGPLNRDIFDNTIKPLENIIRYTRSKIDDPCIAVSILDIGLANPELLKKTAAFLARDMGIDLLTLPDTSGIMTPNLLYERIRVIVSSLKGSRTRIGVHCHNDMGMATANTVVGAVAGASLIEATALGIGERNGIGDIFLVGSALKKQGYPINLKTDNISTFREYYEFVDRLVREKTGSGLLNYNTPFFGDAMHTHVAGTHGAVAYGIRKGEECFLNVLCGKHLVAKFLDSNNIPFDTKQLPIIVKEIKDRSAEKGRSILKEDVLDIVGRVSPKPGS